MRYPRFLEEMREGPRRRNLLHGVYSGYGIALSFEVITVLGQSLGVVPRGWALHLLVLAKLCTNTLAWLGLRKDVLALELGSLNVSMDVLVMTGTIYFTGGPLSPLFAMYAIEVAVLALLTNLGITLLAAGGAALTYASMSLAVQAGWLPRHPPPVVYSGGLSLAYALTDILWASLFLMILTLSTSLILRRMRAQEEALEQKNRDLLDANAQKGHFMANITHELRTPIHGIQGLTELLEGEVYGPVTEKQREAFASIDRSAAGLLAMIDELLELARSDAGKLEYKPSEVPLRELLEGVLPSVRWLLGTRATKLELALEEPLPERILTDRARLVQILVNLLTNALKFTPEEGKVTLRARVEGERLALSVEDTGIGIPPEELPHIWERFRQVDGSSSRRYGGAGLGLALVQRLVELLGAAVEVRSVLGSGSTFTVRLPLERA